MFRQLGLCPVYALLGKQLELIQYDTQSDIANFPKFAKKLILEDQVAVIHGGITSASRESFRPVIDEYGRRQH